MACAHDNVEKRETIQLGVEDVYWVIFCPDCDSVLGEVEKRLVMNPDLSRATLRV